MTIIEPIRDWEDFRAELEIGWSNFLTTGGIYRFHLDPPLSHFALPRYFIVERHPLKSSKFELQAR